MGFWKSAKKENSSEQGWCYQKNRKKVHYYTREIPQRLSEYPNVRGSLIAFCCTPRGDHMTPFPFDSSEFRANLFQGTPPTELCCKRCLKELNKRLHPDSTTPRKERPKPKPPAKQYYHIAQNGKHIGRFTLTEVQKMMASGQVSEQDYYFSSSANNWLGIISIADEPLAENLGWQKYHITQNGQNVGEYTFFEIQQMMAVGQLNEQDYYYSPTAEAWLEVVSIAEETQ